MIAELVLATGVGPRALLEDELVLEEIVDIVSRQGDQQRQVSNLDELHRKLGR